MARVHAIRIHQTGGPEAMRWEEVARSANGLVQTTVGRVIFNDILDPHLPFYDLALSG